MTKAKRLLFDYPQTTKYSNAIANGGLESGTTGWTSKVNTGLTESISTTVFKGGAKSFRATGTGTSQGVVYEQLKTFISGHKYYLSCYGYTETVNASIIGARIYKTTTVLATSYITVTVLNEWKKSESTIYTSDGTETSVGLAIGQTAPNTAYIDNIVLIDLTALGLDSMTASWCDANILPNVVF